MNLIPESNGLYKVKKDGKFKGITKTKYILFFIVAIILIAFITQQVSNFIGNEKIEIHLNYAKVEKKKLEYNLKGEGVYTVVFIGATGANLYEWNNVAKLVREQLNLKTFVYNRNGYGFSDIGKIRTPKEQAEDLKILLRKAGVSGNIILVGEEYGSLIVTNFIESYPEVVKGVVLVDPYDEKEIKSQEFNNKISRLYNKCKIETLGCYFYLTSILDKMNKTYKLDGFEESLDEEELEEFNIQKTKKNYRQAIEYELKNLKDYSESSQIDGMLSNKPLFIVSRTDEIPLTRLGSNELTSTYVITSSEGLLSVNSSETINNSINTVYKAAKKIAKKDK